MIVTLTLTMPVIMTVTTTLTMIMTMTVKMAVTMTFSMIITKIVTNVSLYDYLLTIEMTMTVIMTVTVTMQMNIVLTVCAWMYGRGFKLGCSKIKEVFWGDCCDILGGMDYCLVLMQILDVAKSQKYFWVTVVIFLGGWIIVWY